jgi:hypothetical protein
VAQVVECLLRKSKLLGSFSKLKKRDYVKTRTNLGKYAKERGW